MEPMRTRRGRVVLAAGCLLAGPGRRALAQPITNPNALGHAPDWVGATVVSGVVGGLLFIGACWLGDHLSWETGKRFWKPLSVAVGLALWAAIFYACVFVL